MLAHAEVDGPAAVVPRATGGPGNRTRVDSARSAEPPTSSGSRSDTTVSILPEAARVASAPPARNGGSASSPPSGRTRALDGPIRPPCRGDGPPIAGRRLLPLDPAVTTSGGQPLEGVPDVGGDGERLIGPAETDPREGQFLGAERGAVRGGGPRLGG